MKWIRGGNCCANKILSLRKEFSYRQNIIWHKSYQCFLKSVSQGNRNKNKQMEDRQTYKLLHSKRNHKKNKRQPTEWEKIFANDATDEGVISKIYKQLIELNNNKKCSQKLGRRLKQTSLQERHRWHMKRCLMLLMIREMQSEATTRYHLIPVRMTIIKKSTNNKWWRGSGEKETLLQCWWKHKLEQSLWKTVWRFLRKLKIELQYDPATPLLEIHLDSGQNYNSKGYKHSYVHSSIIHNSQDLETT